jgi:hypothetical protein
MHLIQNAKPQSALQYDSILKQFRVFLSRLREQVQFHHQGVYVHEWWSDEGKKFLDLLSAVEKKVQWFEFRSSGVEGDSRFYLGEYQDKARDVEKATGKAPFLSEDELSHVSTNDQYYEALFQKYPALERIGRRWLEAQKKSEEYLKSGFRKDLKKLVKPFDDLLSFLYQEAEKVVQLDPPALEEIDTEFDLFGVKVIIEDPEVKPKLVDWYTRAFKEAYHRLRQKGLGQVWRGEIFVKPKSLAGVNQYGPGLGVAARYDISKDRIYVYMYPDKSTPEVITHEMAHRYWFKEMREPERARFSDWLTSGRVPAVSDYGTKHPAEGFAEAMAYLVMGNDMTRDQMESLRSVLARVNLPRATWVEGFPRDLDIDQQQEMWDIYHTSYGAIGTHVGSLSEMLTKYDIFWLNDIDGDNSIDAFLAYKRTRFGNKLGLMGSDGSSQAKRAVVEQAVSLLRKPGWYMEASGKPTQIIEGAGVRRIVDEEVVRRVLQGKDLVWEGDGWYKRDIGALGAKEKALYGHPKVASLNGLGQERDMKTVSRVAQRYVRAALMAEVGDPTLMGFVRAYLLKVVSLFAKEQHTSFVTEEFASGFVATFHDLAYKLECSMTRDGSIMFIWLDPETDTKLEWKTIPLSLIAHMSIPNVLGHIKGMFESLP